MLLETETIVLSSFICKWLLRLGLLSYQILFSSIGYYYGKSFGKLQVLLVMFHISRSVSPTITSIITKITRLCNRRDQEQNRGISLLDILKSWIQNIFFTEKIYSNFKKSRFVLQCQWVF